ncbi:bactofilin family protein [Photobacterium sanctipauli]|uniref:bactofilin family protein n=1 Tax=Photobacterium sanctipauli TaxID=1342794 RepID=UPI00056C3903|nr:polymer-forming cytoskeletal protein [Photobacterium sanctipauli]
MQVDGCIEGKIRLEKLLVVSQSGRIEGEVFADKMIVGGIIKGKCYANTIEILENGKIEGDIYCDDLSIARGGKFLGSTHPEQKEQVVELKQDKKPEKKEESNKAIPKKATAANA